MQSAKKYTCQSCQIAEATVETWAVSPSGPSSVKHGINEIK